MEITAVNNMTLTLHSVYSFDQAIDPWSTAAVECQNDGASICTI
jgi:hypothetical protein